MRPRTRWIGHVRRRYVVVLATGALTASLLPAQAASAADPQTATVAAGQAVHLVDEGRKATVALTLTTSDGQPLAATAALSYATGTGTATAGKDYRVASGTLTFPAGSASGSVQRITLSASKDRAAEVAETVPLTLSSTTPGVSVPLRRPSSGRAPKP